MAALKDELMDHFSAVVLKTASQFQSWNSSLPVEPTCSDVNPCDEFGEHLLACIQGIPIPQVIAGDISMLVMVPLHYSV